MKKRTLTARLISLWLVAALMLVGMPVIAQDAVMTAPTTAAASAVTDVAPAAGETAAASSLLGPGELTLEQLALATLPAGDIPDALPAGKVAEKGHVNRLFEQEEGLAHILFQNRDGGKTAYFYGQPVKYIDADGHTRDKSKTLVPVNKTYGALGYDYGVEQNSIRHYYAKDPAVGILVELGGHTVRIVPQAGASLVLPRGQLNENRMVYNNLFGTNTALVYTPLLSGVKEDILLRSFTGQSDFAFTYRTSGLSLINIDGTYAFVDESGLPLATLGDILITDAAGHTALGSLTVTETANGIYTVIVHADRAFLTAPTTVYPVTVDPTLVQYIGDTIAGSAYIQDYGVYNNTVYSNLGEGYHFLGYANSTTIGRIVYRFPMFIPGATAASYYDELENQKVTSAKFYVYSIGPMNTSATAYPMMYTYNYNNATNKFANSTLFDNCYNMSAGISVSLSGTEGETHIIDMTSLVQQWLKHNNSASSSLYDPANGMSLVNNNEHQLNGTPYFRHVYAVENAVHAPYLEMDYQRKEYKVVMYSILGNTVTPESHDSMLNGVAADMRTYGINDITIRSGNVSSNTCKSDLQGANIFIALAHGHCITMEGSPNLPVSTGIMLNDETGAAAVGFYSHAFEGMTAGSYSMRGESYDNLDIAIFMSCEVAYGGGGSNIKNLVSRIVTDGADVAIGFEIAIATFNINTWVEVFCQKLIAEGTNVNEAVAAANNAVETEGNSTYEDSCVVYGAGNLSLEQLKN